MAMIEIDVMGLPAPKGSKTSFVVKRAGTTGTSRKDFRAVTTDKSAHGTSDKLTPWKMAVAWEVKRAMEIAGNPPPLDGPLVVVLRFWMPRPTSTPKRVSHPTKKPDVDKLARTVLDVCSKIVWTDDARIVDLTVQKRFAADRLPGMTMLISPLTAN